MVEQGISVHFSALRYYLTSSFILTLYHCAVSTCISQYQHTLGLIEISVNESGPGFQAVDILKTLDIPLFKLYYY